MPDFIANMEPHWAWLSLGVLLAAAEIVAGREIDLVNDLISAEQTLAQLISYQLLLMQGRADGMISRLSESFAARHRSAAERFRLASSRLTPQTLRAVIAASANDLALLDHRRTAAVTQLIDRRKDALALQAAKLDAHAGRQRCGGLAGGRQGVFGRALADAPGKGHVGLGRASVGHPEGHPAFGFVIHH